MPAFHPYTIFSNFLYCGKGAFCFWFDLANALLQGATMPHIHPFFGKCYYCGKGALCFRFDLASVFPQVATMPPLNPPIFFGIIIIVGRGIMLLLRLSHGIASGCHNANSTTNFLELLLLWERPICFFDLAMLFLQVATLLPLLAKKLRIFYYCGK